MDSHDLVFTDFDAQTETGCCLLCFSTADSASEPACGRLLKMVTNYKDGWCHLLHLKLYGEMTFKAGLILNCLSCLSMLAPGLGLRV